MKVNRPEARNSRDVHDEKAQACRAMAVSEKDVSTWCTPMTFAVVYRSRCDASDCVDYEVSLMTSHRVDKLQAISYTYTLSA